MNQILAFFLLSLIFTSAMGMYEGNTAVKLITSSTFSQVKKGIWLVEFYADWCGHCKQLAPEYEKAARALQGIANIAAIDGSKEQTDVQIQGFPTIKLFVDGKMSDYDGQRNAESFVEFMLKQFKKVANQRLGGGSSSGSQSSSSHGSGDDDKDVIVLTDDNFDSQVYGDEMAWFVQFYAPWCGHCKSLVPEWNELATNLKGQVKVAKVDATEHKEAAGKFEVKGYPTIKFFPAGKKDQSSAINYEGQRNAAAMAEWAREQTQGAKFFEHIRLTSQSVYDEYCIGRNLCVIVFLPHILDSSQVERQTYLQRVKEVALKFRGKPFKFLWSQGGDHFDFQEKLGATGVGYPVVSVVFESKKLFGKLKRSFNEENLENFLSDILANKARFSKLPEFAKLQQVKEEPASTDSKFGGEGGCDEHLCTAPPSEQKQLQL